MKPESGADSKQLCSLAMKSERGADVGKKSKPGTGAFVWYLTERCHQLKVCYVSRKAGQF